MGFFLLVIGMVMFAVGSFFLYLAKRNIKPGIAYSLIERIFYVQMPPYDDLTDKGKEYAKRGYFFALIGTVIIVSGVLTNMLLK